MSKFTDYYSLLGVAKDATKEDIKKAFMQQALKWHPEKAQEDQKERCTKVYADLQMAYKILINDETRKVYEDSQQSTIFDFRGAERDVGYQTSEKFALQTEDGLKFDAEAFKIAFDMSRDQKDANAIKEVLEKRGVRDDLITEQDLVSFRQKREQERQEFDSNMVNLYAGKEFDRNQFNMMFEHMKKHNGTGDIEEYVGEPQPMFSSGGLVEDDKMSGLQMTNGANMSNFRSYDTIVAGISLNPQHGFNIDQFQPPEDYGYEAPLSSQEIQDRMDAIIKDRIRLQTLDRTEYSTEPTEIEKLYSGLFVQREMEELEPVITARPESMGTKPRTPVVLTKKKITAIKKV